MWNSLPAHSACPTPWCEGEAGHRLVRDLGVHADPLRAVERADEVQRVPDRGQEDVAARLVRLGLERERQVVALLDDVVREHVDRLAVALERVPRILRHPRLGALAAAPEDEHLGVQLGPEVDRQHRLADRGAAHAAVVGRERAVLEHGLAEEVRGGHADAEAGLLQRRLEAGDDAVVLGRGGAVRDEVLVVQRDAPGAELGQLAHGVDRVERGAGRPAERVAAGVADRPQAEGEAVLGAGGQGVGRGHDPNP